MGYLTPSQDIGSHWHLQICLEGEQEETKQSSSSRTPAEVMVVEDDARIYEDAFWYNLETKEEELGGEEPTLREEATQIGLLLYHFSMYSNWPFWDEKGGENVLFELESRGVCLHVGGASELCHLLDSNL